MRMGRLISLGLICFPLVITALGIPAQYPADAADETYICSPGGPCPVDMLAMGNSGNDETAGVSVHSWRGFAVMGDESHPIRFNVETIRAVDPAEARRLLESNISLGEIRSSLGAGDKVPVTEGNMKIENDIYRLINITVTPLGNTSTLDASVAGPIAGPRSRSALNKPDANAGHTTISISSAGGIETGEGTLVMIDPEYNGTYSLSLERQFPGRGPGVGSGQDQGMVRARLGQD
jgi:hypothetical protein